MFSQFMNVVENLAQPQPHRPAPLRAASGSQDLSPERPEHPPRSSGSFDGISINRSLASTGHLAESALSNLRKSLTAQRNLVRPDTPQERVMSPKHDRELKPVGKMNLEDRLRATFAIGEESNPTTPDAVSHVPSPQPPEPVPPEPITSEQSAVPLSPTSTPLPDSPTQYSPSDNSFETAPPLSLPGAVEAFEAELSEDALAVKEVDSAHAEMTNLTHDDSSLEPVAESLESLSDTVKPAPSLEPTPLPTTSPIESDAEDLHERTRSLEQQLADVTTYYKRLQTIFDAANSVLTQFSPLRDISDSAALERHLRDINNKGQEDQDRIKLLNVKLQNFDERLEELRDTHRLESHSQLEQVQSLRKQVAETEALLQSAQGAASLAAEESRKRQAEVDQLRSEAQKLRDVAKDEEEKRVKAISLLKTVRQKLVKAEKDRDEATKEVSLLKDRDSSEREKEKQERQRLEKELESVRAEKERDIVAIKSHFDRELANFKERMEKEYVARRGQVELEAVAARNAHQREAASMRSQIQSLESAVHSLTAERDSLFDQLQLRQGEVESSQSHIDELQGSVSELQFQLREAQERVSLLTDELGEARREQEHRASRPSVSAEESSRTRALIEAKYEAKVADLSARLTAIERERSETEAILNCNLQQKAQEVDTLRQTAESALRVKELSESELSKFQQEIRTLAQQSAMYKTQIIDFDKYKDRVIELEASLQSLREDLHARTEQHEGELKEAKEREAHFRAMNKSLKEDLRKVQASAALLERQRNPGVGYWGITRQDNSSERRLSLSSQPDQSSNSSSPRVGSPTPSKSDEEVNLEYLRNVILQFLEHKEMRPHLVRVLSIILHFTPQETRRLVAKVSS